MVPHLGNISAVSLGRLKKLARARGSSVKTQPQAPDFGSFIDVGRSGTSIGLGVDCLISRNCLFESPRCGQCSKAYSQESNTKTHKKIPPTNMEVWGPCRTTTFLLERGFVHFHVSWWEGWRYKFQKLFVGWVVSNSRIPSRESTVQARMARQRVVKRARAKNSLVPELGAPEGKQKDPIPSGQCIIV